MCTELFPKFLYYAYAPAILISVGFGIFLYRQNKKEAISKFLSLIALIFSIWLIIDFFTWFPWSTGAYLNFQRAEMLIFVIPPLLIYFANALIGEKIGKLKQVFVWLPLLPIMVLSFSPYYRFLYSVLSANDGSCAIKEEVFYPYIYVSAFAYLAWFVFILLKTYRSKKINLDIKNRIRIVLYAISIFIFWVAIFTKIQDVLGDDYALFIPFGMVILIGMFSYAITQYKLFNIKILKSQALVAVLVILIGALFFYIQDIGGILLISVNLLLASFFGRLLIKSVKAEVRKSEELEVANAKISERGKELEKMAQSLAMSNDQLKIANNKLQELDQSKSDFFARASHDLRTPLTSIKGFISLLQEGSYGEVPEQQKGVLDKVFTVSQRMTALVEDFLTASKLEAGGMQYNFAKCKVETICKEITDMLFTKANDKGLYLKFDNPQEDLPEITIDASRIMESVSNLVDNAVKYTEKGGITIKLEHGEFSNYKRPEITNKDEEVTADIKGAVLRITVADTGMGIPKDGIDLLFAKYSRGKGDARVKTKGTGLGLYVGKRMIEDNGGKVWAESDGEGLGSRFIVELPVEPPMEVLEKIKKEQEMQKVA